MGAVQFNQREEVLAANRTSGVIRRAILRGYCVQYCIVSVALGYVHFRRDHDI